MSRKHWFKVADAVLFERWTNDQLATFVRLAAYLNTRWSRDSLTHDEACRAELDTVSLYQITGKRRRDVALKCLAGLAQVAGMSVADDGQVTEIFWPKYADFQRRRSPPTPTPTPAPTPTPKNAPTERAGPPQQGGLEGIPQRPGWAWLTPLLAAGDASKRAEVEAFLGEHWALIEAEADRELGEDSDTKRRSGTIKSIAIRYWRQEQKRGEPRFKDPLERAADRAEAWVKGA